MCTLSVNVPSTVVSGYKDLISQPIHPDLQGPPKPGRIYFTGQIHTNLNQGQKIRTGSNNPDSRRKNQKSRPWIVLYVRENGNVAVVSLTTRNNKIWGGLVGNDVNSFLPLGSTPKIPGRDSVELLSNTCGIFKGTSLIFLEIERLVPPSSLGHPVGQITPEGLELVRKEREICGAYWRQQSGEQQVYTGQWKSQSHIQRPLHPANSGRPRASSIRSGQQFPRDQFVRRQFGGGHFERNQFERSQFERSQFEKSQFGGGQFDRNQFEQYQVERSQFERGQIGNQIGVTQETTFRRWSV